jgi:hypothetical protein
MQPHSRALTHTPRPWELWFLQCSLHLREESSGRDQVEMNDSRACVEESTGDVRYLILDAHGQYGGCRSSPVACIPGSTHLL